MKKTYSILALLISIYSIQSFAQARKPVARPVVAGLSAQMAAGHKIYMSYCLSCHQADGVGVQNMNPPLIKTSYVLGDKNKIIKIVLKGFNEQVEINGDTYTNVMPNLSVLKDQEIADVLTFIRHSFGNKASAVHAAEVTAVRNKK
jgi:mono/diheme cytochrome c family protein